MFITAIIIIMAKRRKDLIGLKKKLVFLNI